MLKFERNTEKMMKNSICEEGEEGEEEGKVE